MAENDIYDNQKRYETFKEKIDTFHIPPNQRQGTTYRNSYYCKNKDNIKYFKKLFNFFEAKDNSYIRRLRIFRTFILICHATDKDLKDCDRDDINSIVAFMHTRYPSSKSKSDFIKDMRYLWKTLFPETDTKGRQDETIVPHVVRHLSPKMDKSREKLRNDRLTWEEFEKILTYFSHDPRMQAYLFLALESLGRPQELLYTKIKDIQLFDHYAKIWISEHGKEGTGFLECIDSYPYFIKWYNQHPLKHDPESYIFINLHSKGRAMQLHPKNVNSLLKRACRKLNITKNITAYSLKRNGVSFRRLRGDRDIEIQHAARWTSTKQLKTYDMTQHEDSFKMALIKRGIITSNEQEYNKDQAKTKLCIFCKKINGFTNEVCEQCTRPLDREKIKQQEYAQQQRIEDLQKELLTVKTQQPATQSKDLQELFGRVAQLQEELIKMKTT